MADGTGLATQIGYAAEVAYGTRVAPARFLDHMQESVKFDPGRRESPSIRAGRRVMSSKRWQPSKKAVSGSIQHPFLDAGMGLLLEHSLCAVQSSQPNAAGSPTVWEHAFTLGDPIGKYLTVQIGRASTDGTVNPFDYLGVKIPKWTITQDMDADLLFEIDVDGRDEDTSQALAVASYPADAEVFGWEQLAVTVDGNPFYTTKATIEGDNKLKTDRYFAGSRLKKEPLTNDLTGVSASLEGEFTDTTAYELVRAGTLVACTFNWTGRAIDGSYNYALEISMPSCRIDGDTPVAGGPDEIPQMLNIVALDDGTEPITITYRTTDTTP